MLERLDDVTVPIASTASAAETEVVACEYAVAASSTALVEPVNPAPVTLPVQAFVVIECTVTMPVTVGTALVDGHAQVPLGTKTASSVVFRRMTILPEFLAALTMVESSLH